MGNAFEFGHSDDNKNATGQMEVVGLTVAICTRNRPEKLRRALLSLTKQTFPPNEIIVVDNAPSDDATRMLVTQHFPNIRYVQELRLGLDFARNRALQESKNSIVALLDDDIVADRGWAKEIIKVFRENSEVGVCTGRIQPLSLETEAQCLFEEIGGFSRGDVQIRLPRDVKKPLHGRRAPLVAWAVRLGIGCNMALRRSVALACGGFDETLETGPVLTGGGDVDMLWRILMDGFEALYEPRALVWHEHRRDLRSLFDQILGHHIGMLTFLFKTIICARGSERIPVLFYFTWRLLKPGIRLVRRLVRRDPLPASVLLRMWGGCWRGLAYYWEARRLTECSHNSESQAFKANQP
jgi:GT2 family glycosyltransferase